MCASRRAACARARIRSIHGRGVRRDRGRRVHAAASRDGFARGGRGRLRRGLDQDGLRNQSRRLTLTDVANPAREPLPGGYKTHQPHGLCGIYPADGADYETSRKRSRSSRSTTPLSLRAGNLAGARLRLPLRLPRAFTHGDHQEGSSASSTSTCHDRAERHLQDRRSNGAELT